jgi:hypothetical protein
MCWHSTQQIHRSAAPLILLMFSECGLSCPSKSTAHILGVRAILSLEAYCLHYSSAGFGPSNRSFGFSASPYYSSAGFGPSNRLHRASSASILFECGRSVPRIASLGLQRLHIIRVRASVPRIASLGLQRLHIIRVRASVPRIVFIGPAAPPNYSSTGFGPSNHFLRASSAFILLKCGLRSLESSTSGQQRLYVIRLRASVPRIILFRPAAPLRYSSVGFDPSNRIFWPSVLSFYSDTDRCPSNLYFGLSMLSTQNARILVAIYQFGCRMSNTKVSPRFAIPNGPVFVSSALCREIFHTYGMKFAPMDASGASQ